MPTASALDVPVHTPGNGVTAGTTHCGSPVLLLLVNDHGTQDPQLPPQPPAVRRADALAHPALPRPCRSPGRRRPPTPPLAGCKIRCRSAPSSRGAGAPGEVRRCYRLPRTAPVHPSWPASCSGVAQRAAAPGGEGCTAGCCSGSGTVAQYSHGPCGTRVLHEQQAGLGRTAAGSNGPRRVPAPARRPLPGPHPHRPDCSRTELRSQGEGSTARTRSTICTNHN